MAFGPGRRHGAAMGQAEARRGDGAIAMNVNVACPHCSKTLKTREELAGRNLRCAHCGRMFVLNLTGQSNEGRGSGTGEHRVLAGRPSARPEDAVSRSMLVPSPGAEAQKPTPQALICRLAPGTLAWLDATPAARAFFGEPLDTDGAARGGFLDRVHPDDRTLARDALGTAAEHGERHDLVLRLKSAGGAWRFVRVHAQARYDRDGGLNHVRCVLNDVTDEVRAEQELRRRTEQLTAANEQLRQANERLKEAQSRLVHSEKLAALGTLAAGIAHEINNPLGFATSNAAVLERDVTALVKVLDLYEQGKAALSPELAARIEVESEAADLPYVRAHIAGAAQAVGRGLRRVAQIVKDLRGFAQVDRGDVVALDVNASLDQCLSLLSDHLHRLRVQVVRDFAPLPPLECRGAAVNQVLLNLVMNALQAVEDGGKPAGRIKVSTRAEGGGREVVVEIGDDGCGIPQDVLPRIFDPFFTTKSVGRGTGLGLSFSHGIVSDHGGRIEVESVFGLGSSFRVTLPTAGGGKAPR